MQKKIVFISFIISIILLVFSIFIFQSNNIDTSKDYTLFLKNEVPFKNVMDSLKLHHVLNSNLSARIFLISYPIHHVKAGRYKLNKTMSNLELFRKLKYGFEDPIKLTISTATFIDEIAYKIEQKFGIKADSFLLFLSMNKTQANYNFTFDQRLCNIYPMTYDISWNITLAPLFDKIHKGKLDFWTAERKQKAQKMNMTENEVYILASLIQKEYSKKEERSKIAGVLINRLQIQMPLQVDATCKYATRDFNAKRVTGIHLRSASPFNTYKNKGLPPGPICIPELSTIDACLNFEKHDYLYYCADPRLNGFHLFSKTWEEHQNIAQNYYKKVNSLNL